MPRKVKPTAREPTIQVGLRLPRSIVKRIDLHAERLRKEMGLLGVTRTDAAVALLAGGLKGVERNARKW